MTPCLATTNALNVLSGDSVSFPEGRGPVVASAYIENLPLGQLVHPVEFTANPARFQASGPSAMPNVSCSGDPLKVFDAVVVAHGVDVVDLLSGIGWSKKRYSYEAVQEKQSGPTVTQIGAKISIPGRGGFYKTTSLCGLTANIAPEFSVSGDGIAGFVSGDWQPVSVCHG